MWGLANYDAGYVFVISSGYRLVQGLRQAYATLCDDVMSTYYRVTQFSALAECTSPPPKDLPPAVTLPCHHTSSVLVTFPISCLAIRLTGLR
jgi:hypothetical protein